MAITKEMVRERAARTGQHPVNALNDLRREYALTEFLSAVERVQDVDVKAALFALHQLLRTP